MSSRSDVTTGPLPIGQFVQMVRRTIVQDSLFRNQALKGEVTQCKKYASGHTYFSLRDNDGQMSAVIWKGKCAVDPSIKEGSEVVVLASLDLYAKRGNIQLIVDKIEPISILGELEKKKRQLIEQLKREGEIDSTFSVEITGKILKTNIDSKEYLYNEASAYGLLKKLLRYKKTNMLLD